MNRYSPSPSIQSLRNGNIGRDPSTINSAFSATTFGFHNNGCSPISYTSLPHTTTGETIGALVGASITVIDNTIYVFAGFDQYTDEVFNKLYKLTYNEHGECQWIRVVYTKGRPPEKRNDHSATLWGKDKLVIFGGSSEEEEEGIETFYNGISILDLTTMTWEHPTTFGYQPIGRIKHSATIHNNKLYIAGGILPASNATSQGSFPNTLLILDLTTWVWQDPIPFVSRSQHITFVYNHRLYLFGGLQEDMTRSNYLSFIDLSRSNNNNHNGTVTHVDIHSPFAPSITSQKFLQICGHQLVVVVVETPSSLYNNSDPPRPPSSSSTSSASSTFSGVWTLNLESMQWQYYGQPFGTQLGNQWHWMNFAMAEHGSHFYLFGTNDEFPDDYFSKILCIDLKEVGIIPIPPPRLGYDLSHLLQLELTKPDFIIQSSIYEKEKEEREDEEDKEGKEIKNRNRDNRNDEKEHAIYVHRLILLARWPYFYKKQLEMAHGNQFNLLTLNQPLSTLKIFVDYLYKDCLEETIPIAIICDLLVMGYEYEMERLFALCLERLYQNMNVNNVSKIYYTAHLTHQTSLQHYSLYYIFQHFGAVSHSEEFRNLPRSIFFQILDKMPSNASLVSQQHIHMNQIDMNHHEDENEGDNHGSGNEINNDHQNNHHRIGLMDHYHELHNQNGITIEEDVMET
ncbi:hypothetical protein BJ944DRAFT_194709 [Cunninghamella echinulata]|nr:hypothetical protein BJ944DRAFT_194709 [Cunninghamella echinulata]